MQLSTDLADNRRNWNLSPSGSDPFPSTSCSRPCFHHDQKYGKGQMHISEDTDFFLTTPV